MNVHIISLHGFQVSTGSSKSDNAHYGVVVYRKELQKFVLKNILLQIHLPLESLFPFQVTLVE